MIRLRSSKAFTLIELLVVISIIALLVAILLPALSQARKSAQKVQCASNLRQQAVALSSYVADYGVYLPGVLSFANEPNSVMHWYPGQLFKYMNGKEPTGFTKVMTGIFRCPAMDEGFQKSYPDIAINGTWWNSYAMNGFLVSGDDPHNPTVLNWPDMISHKPSEVKHPSQTLLFIDYLFYPEIYYISDFNHDLHPTHVQYRHTRTANVAFADGHVATLKQSEGAKIMNGHVSGKPQLLSEQPPLRLVGK